MAVPQTVPLHRLTFEDVEAMERVGILRETDRVELEGGVLVDMVPPGEPHGDRVEWFTRHFYEGRPDDVRIRTEATFSITDGGFYLPDVVVFTDKPEGELPRTALLVVEIAVTSRARDLEKAAAYAAAAVGEYWILDVERSEVLVHTEPRPDGYTVVRRCLPGDTLTPPAGLPPVEVAAALGL